MPIPKPKADESKNDYVSRCVKKLSDDGDFKDQNQRLAVCYAQYKNKEAVSEGRPYLYIPILEDVQVENKVIEKGDIVRILKENTGETIYKQIKAMDPRALMAWGAKNLAVENGVNNGIIGYEHKNLGKFQFDARGPKFKGRIIIMLMPDDTYTVIAGVIRNLNWSVKKIVEDVYVDVLIQVIDDIVG